MSSPKPASAGSPPEHPAGPPSARTILIIDDDADLRETLAEVFSEEGWRVEVAKDGRQGLERLLGGAPPALVLLDVHMPHRTGVEVYTAMREAPSLAGTKVVFMTSDAARAPSGVPLVKKPFDLDRLLKVVTQVA